VTRAVIDSLADVEREATNPTGWRKALRGTLTALANTLPELALLATVGTLLYNFMVNENHITPGIFEMSLVVLIPLVVIIAMQMLIMLLLPIRWPAIRERFRSKLATRMSEELERAYLKVPDDIAMALREERKQVDTLLAETKTVSDFLAERQQAAQVTELYGS
jgi:hypothetical protein